MTESRTDPLVILIVDRDPIDGAAIAEHFSTASATSSPVRVVSSPTVDDVPPSLLATAPDAVLLAISDAEELASLRDLRRAITGPPVILLAPESADLEQRALRDGAQDVVTRPLPAPHVLTRIVIRACERHRRATAQDASMRSVSHDLRNALSTIQICAATLLEPGPTPVDRVRKLGALIQRSALWMQQILDDLADHARRETEEAASLRFALPVASSSEGTRLSGDTSG